MFLETPNKIAPVTKSLRKAIILRSNKKGPMKTGTIIKSKGIVMLKTKEKYFCDINVKSISDSKKLWKTVKPFFSNKGFLFCFIFFQNTNNMMLVENNKAVREEEIIANILNNYFTKHYHPPKTQTHQNRSQSETGKYNRYLPKS